MGNSPSDCLVCAAFAENGPRPSWLTSAQQDELLETMVEITYVSVRGRVLEGSLPALSLASELRQYVAGVIGTDPEDITMERKTHTVLDQEFPLIHTGAEEPTGHQSPRTPTQLLGTLTSPDLSHGSTGSPHHHKHHKHRHKSKIKVFRHWQPAALCGARDSNLRLWAMASGSPLYTLEGHTAGVTCVNVDWTARFAISGSGDMTLRLWDLTLQLSIGHLKGHRGGVTCVSTHWPEVRAASGGLDHLVCLWDLQKLKLLASLEGHIAAVTSVALDWRLGRVLSGSADRTVKLWDTKGVLLANLEGHGGPVVSLCADWKDQTAYSCCADGQVKHWDLQAGAAIGGLQFPSQGLVALQVDWVSKQALAAFHGHIELWDLSLEERKATVGEGEQRAGAIRCVEVDWNGMQAAATADDGTCTVWDLKTGEVVSTMAGHGFAVDCAAFFWERKTVRYGTLWWTVPSMQQEPSMWSGKAGSCGC